MWYSDSHPLDIQHEVKLADGERNSMIVLLLASHVAVFPRFFLPISLHPPVPELLLVEQSSHHASAVLDLRDLGQGNVWVWISLLLGVHKNDFCLTWLGFSTERWIPADCWNSFIC